MAVPTNTGLTFSLNTAIREDLQDVIYNIDPTDTPFVSNVGQATADQTYHEWLKDTLASPADNKAVEGDDPSNKALVDVTRLGNYTQISEKTVSVSETQISVNEAGISDRLAYEMSKKLKEIKRDLEFSLVGTSKARVNATNSTTARESASVVAWIYTNTDFNSGGTPGGADPSGDGSDTRTDSGTTRALTESMFEGLIDQVWVSGGDPTMVLVDSTSKRVITGFTGNATRYKDVNERSVINAVDVYVSDYGELQIVPDRYIRTRDVLVIDPEFWAVAWLRPMTSRPLAKTGDSERRQIIGEWTLEARNEKSSGVIADIS